MNMEKWVVLTKKADFNEIGEQFSIDPVIARIIRNRDVIGEKEIETYLKGDVSYLLEPGLMKDLKKAVDIVLQKVKEEKKIRVIGDYDIDGIQSSYILWEGIRRCNGNVDIAIPNRISDGYGLNERLIREAYEDGVDTIITCDNGIAAAEVIAKGKEMGMTVIVTDHHEIPYEDTPQGRNYIIPCADAVVNPKQLECKYPFKGLCGAGIAYKFIQALLEEMGRESEEIYEFLPYAAFATIGDVMDLTGENRILVKEGLKRLKETKNKGLRALMFQNNLMPQDIKAYHIGFVLGPCINASGRLDTAVRALELMQAEDEKHAVELAKDLVDLNTGRKELTIKGVELADVLAQEAIEKGDKVLVLFLPECHESLAGIIAGRIREKYNRPTFILTRGEEEIKGSGRSIEGYSMYEELCKIKDIFIKFGGHPMAAGVSLKEEKISAMRERLNELSTLAPEDFIAKIRIDVPMPLDYITIDLVKQLELLEPFGKGNEKPVFADKDIQILALRIIGKNNNVCKMQVMSKLGTRMEAVFFGDAMGFLEELRTKFGEESVGVLLRGELPKKPIKMSFVYYPDLNCFNGRESLQIVVKNYC